MTAPDQYATVRYLVNDVPAAIDFYTTPDHRPGGRPILLADPRRQPDRTIPIRRAHPSRN